MIQMKDSSDTKTINSLVEDLSNASDGVMVISTHADLMANEKINKMINLTFYSIIAITMFLCFFSLCASMSANLYEQKKEVAILAKVLRVFVETFSVEIALKCRQT